ncbi:MAG: hypothetical protein ABI442_15550 [Gemmatimonadaceae bacterium]
MLFPPADHRRTVVSLLTWWESRRGMFNVVVGAAGLVTLAALRLISWMPPGLQMPFAWQPVVAYGILANICYTFGWGIEATLQRVWKEKCPAVGPALFRQGLSFSVGLTLLPILIASIGWVAHVLMLLAR